MFHHLNKFSIHHFASVRFSHFSQTRALFFFCSKVLFSHFMVFCILDHSQWSVGLLKFMIFQFFKFFISRTKKVLFRIVTFCWKFWYFFCGNKMDFFCHHLKSWGLLLRFLFTFISPLENNVEKINKRFFKFKKTVEFSKSFSFFLKNLRNFN